MARKSKSPRASSRSGGSRKSEVVAAVETDEEQAVGGAENTVIGVTTFCLLVALTMLIMASGQVG